MSTKPAQDFGRKRHTLENPHVVAGDIVELDFGDHRSCWQGPYVVEGICPAKDAPYRVRIEGVGACVPNLVRRIRIAELQAA